MLEQSKPPLQDGIQIEDDKSVTFLQSKPANPKSQTIWVAIGIVLALVLLAAAYLYVRGYKTNEDADMGITASEPTTVAAPSSSPEPEPEAEVSGTVETRDIDNDLKAIDSDIQGVDSSINDEQGDLAE